MHRFFTDNKIAWGLIAVSALLGLGIVAIVSASSIGMPIASGQVSIWLYGTLQLIVCAGLAFRAFKAQDKIAWTLLAGGVFSWCLGDAIKHFTGIDALAFVCYALFYVLCLAFMAAFMKRNMIEKDRCAVLLDGIISSLTVLACNATILSLFLDISWSHPSLDTVHVFYVVGDLLLIGVAVAGISVVHPRVRSPFKLISAGFMIQLFADSIFWVTNMPEEQMMLNPVTIGWSAAFVFFVVAAWVKDNSSAKESGSSVLLSMVCGVMAIGLLLADNWIQRISVGISIVAASALLLSMLRTYLLFREKQTMLVSSLAHAYTDELTQLGNRRQLILNLQTAIDSKIPYTLTLFDLNGFKEYNDLFGHPAGDDLLYRLGQQFKDTVTANSDTRVYRIGGDEFCMLAPTKGHEQTLQDAQLALEEAGDGFKITASFGCVQLPIEASDDVSALKLVDQRMYKTKNRGRMTVQQQVRVVLETALHERKPHLEYHDPIVVGLVESTGRKLGLTTEAIHDITTAANLHDIGKIALADSILEKEGELDHRDWHVMRQHTLIGHRILSSAPAMRLAADIILSTHEKWDGSGYPYGLQGEDIPLGSRIIAVCEAYEAIVNGRSYKEAQTPVQALEELLTCAGTQFDPVVVEAFVGVVEQQVKHQATS